MANPGIPEQVKGRVIAMAREGASAGKIQRELVGKISMGSIYRLMREARRNGEPIERQVRSRAEDYSKLVCFWLPSDVHAELETQAKKRKLRHIDLARQLMTVILDDDMIAAVLDDGR